MTIKLEKKDGMCFLLSFNTNKIEMIYSLYYVRWFGLLCFRKKVLGVFVG